ncbi:hypothetical protein ASPCAL04846 [Aspergillus calidoustus]|uniref:Uncharacterized protein n=1 Tax=Aspergillus calidoustus TaxID=454130 RepID=A0A0U5GS63_ASPCI|nr:hypothetical protein ASPCAL04846 [Aspergillus calidoustus]
MSLTSASKSSVWVVTGANRGIGLGLVKELVARPSTTVIATVRNDEAAASLCAETIAPGAQSSLHIIQLDFSTAISPEAIRERLAAAAPSVEHIDVLINNAGFSTRMNPAVETTADELRSCFEVNTIAPLLVFQALWPLLQKAPSSPKYISVSSSVGSIGGQERFPGGAYGPSKAATNWLTKALHLQHAADGLVAIALHPGWVQTNLGNIAARDWNYAPGPPETVDNSVRGILQIVDEATRETASGKFLSYTGDMEVPW